MNNLTPALFLQKPYTFRFLNTEYSRSCRLGPIPILTLTKEREKKMHE